MHEHFLTASVSESDFDTACAVLQGLTWMTARKTTYRVLFFQGQPQPRGLPVAPQPHVILPQYRPFWAELAKQLTRASYVLQACYEVSPDSHFGTGGAANGSARAAMDLDTMPATLRWTDMPDPQRDSPVTSRKRIDVPFQTRLPSTLHENKHVYTNELIQETYLYIRDDLEIVFSRYYHVPPAKLPNSQPPPPGNRPVQHLPAWEDLRPVDPAQKWVLTVKLTVLDDSQPEKVRKAHDELLRVKTEFDRLFDFRPVDRRVFDTRIAPPVGRLPP